MHAKQLCDMTSWMGLDTAHFVLDEDTMKSGQSDHADCLHERFINCKVEQDPLSVEQELRLLVERVTSAR